MRVSREQAEQNRRAIITAAARLFRERGYEAVGVAEVMNEAGFTHGGFYNHFASKEDLASETCRCTFEKHRAEAARDLAAKHGTIEALHGQLDGYISAAHRDGIGAGCPTAAMVADAARQGGAVQAEFAKGIAGYIRSFAKTLAAGAPERADHRTTAAALLAQSVGAIVLARAVAEANPAMSDELLAAGRAAVTTLLAAPPKAVPTKPKRTR